MIELREQGLYCPAGDFYIDPRRGVENAIVTHAHSDHARRGSKNYFCARTSVRLMKDRLGPKIQTQSYEFGETFTLGRVRVSLHSAGHILGSAQVRIELDGEVWVASGDYKREPDPTCEPFEVVPCDVFITEATFGTPSYRWSGADPTRVGKQIYSWWTANARAGMNSVLYAYSLGKAQRVLGELLPFAHRPIWTHEAVTSLTDCYRSEGVQLAETRCLSSLFPGQRLSGELIVTPQSKITPERERSLGIYQTGFASGWMAGGSRGYDQGFLLSDHADWDALVRTIQETGAKEVYVQHRGTGALVKHLRDSGIEAHPESALAPGQRPLRRAQMSIPGLSV